MAFSIDIFDQCCPGIVLIAGVLRPQAEEEAV
jgi:hypothetical protein